MTEQIVEEIVVETPIDGDTPPVAESTPPVVPTTPPAPQGPPDGFVEVSRFAGATKKIEELMIANRDAEGQLLAAKEQIASLQLSVDGKSREADIVVGERDKLLSSQAEELASLRTENAKLRAYQRKVEMAKGLGKPELINVLHIIPDMEDDEALKAVMTDVIGFRQEGVQQREHELTTGIIPVTPSFDDVESTPTTAEGWDRLIDSFPLGSRERAKALEDKGDWLFKK
jgi:hypothetical protein